MKSHEKKYCKLKNILKFSCMSCSFQFRIPIPKSKLQRKSMVVLPFRRRQHVTFTTAGMKTVIVIISLPDSCNSITHLSLLHSGNAGKGDITDKTIQGCCLLLFLLDTKTSPLQNFKRLQKPQDTTMMSFIINCCEN